VAVWVTAGCMRCEIGILPVAENDEPLTGRGIVHDPHTEFFRHDSLQRSEQHARDTNSFIRSMGSTGDGIKDLYPIPSWVHDRAHCDVSGLCG
jgi:hypothetical protein